MKTFEIMLNTNIDVKDFVNIVNKYDFEIDLISGRYVVDAKSIMGIFSLDLGKAIRVELHTDAPEAIYEELKRFLAQYKLQKEPYAQISACGFFIISDKTVVMASPMGKALVDKAKLFAPRTHSPCFFTTQKSGLPFGRPLILFET